MWLVYSKTQGDNLPIMGTQIAERQPCYVPTEYERHPDKDYHYTELDAKNVVQCSEVNDHSRDFRYTKVGYQISEYKLLDSNGVIESIEDSMVGFELEEFALWMILN